MRVLIPLVLLAALIPACYPDYGLTTSDYRTVVTVYDTAVYNNPTEKAELSTYFLIDSVFHILEEGSKDSISRKYDQRILDGIAANFNSLGWTRITDTAGSNIPTTLVRVSATKNTNSSYYWSWWGGYYPWYGGGWWGYPGWGYPGYYPPYWGSGGYYEYSTGSVIVEQDRVILPSNPTDSLELKPIWIGSSNGLLSGTEKTDVNRVSFEIRQMFTQSPYLVLDPQP